MTFGRYRCVCGWTGTGDGLTLHPRQGFRVCPHCWRHGTERIAERMFKVLRDSDLRHENNVPYWLPFSAVEKWAERIRANHDQTVERLDERGGLSPAELWCAAHDKSLRAILDKEIDDIKALPWLRAIAEAA